LRLCDGFLTTEVFAAITVRDRDAAVEYYERLLGAAPTMLPNDDEAAWQLTGGGWLYVLRDAERAGRAVVLRNATPGRQGAPSSAFVAQRPPAPR
jgi:hypothetical protein